MIPTTAYGLLTASGLLLLALAVASFLSHAIAAVQFGGVGS